MGDRLRQARRARGLSLRGLAEVVGVSPSLISQVETGRAKPSVNTLYALATELGISLDVLLFMDTQPPPPNGADDASAAGRWRPRRRTFPFSEPSSRSTIRLGSGVVWERLTTESIRNVDFLHVTYEVGRRVEPGRRVPAPLRPGVGLRAQRDARPSASGSTSTSSSPATRSASIPPSPTGCSTPGTCRRARCGSSRAAGPPTSSSADRPAPSAGAGWLQRSCNPA